MGLFQLLSIVALICPAAFGRGDTFRGFKCANGVQVQKAWMCDGEDDCGDNSDEDNPECQHLTCSPSQFQCVENGRCIPKSLTCDKEPDCPDQSDEDENMCRTTECLPGQFKCSDKECIPFGWVCDGKVDCKNGTDEASCNKTCSHNEFSCGDGKHCVNQKWVCDGDKDCPNGSDEQGCAKSKCDQKTDFTCLDGSCIPWKFLCDGDFDCIDRSDETNCTQGKHAHGLKNCQTNQFECPDKLTCIHETWLCDLEWDCPDGADESPEYCANICAAGMFQCKNKQCVPGSAQCDGQTDCNDGSDEENCTSKGMCGPHEVDCGSGLCLPIDKACNGVQECANGADEGPLCGINECLIKNGGCDHSCVDQPLGHHCKCNEGYKLVGNFTCVDIDECTERYGSCSQGCKNLEGSFVCSCHQGYTIDPSDPTRCKADVKNPYLIFTKREDIRKLSLGELEDVSIIVNETKLSAALDFHYEAQEIYWSDTFEKIIYKSDIDGLTPKKAIIGTNLDTAEGLAVDWIHGNLYWTDTGKKTIEVSTLDGKYRKTLISTGLEEPRALVVDPTAGWMFWTDWGKNAKIERAGLDGSNRQTIAAQSIRWPNGLTLDLDTKRIYWVDAKLFAVFSSNYDGTERRHILKSSEYLHHPYSVTVFEDRIYWSDWERQMIYRADKFDGRHLTPVGETRTLQNPMTLQVYHPYRQPRSENLCLKTSCSHMCFPTPKSKANGESSVVCSCPDEMVLSGDGATCIPITTTSDTSVPTQTPSIISKFPTIYINYTPSGNPTLSDREAEINWLLVLLIILAGSALTTFVLVSVCACAYKVYFNGNFKIMNFDNPIYHKTPTQDPLCTVESSEPSAPSTPGEEVRQPFCPV